MEEELENLQNYFALVDLMTRNGRSGLIEVLIKELQPLRIRMEQDINHKIPHIHIDYGKIKHIASYSIQSGEKLAGNLDNKYDKIVKEWVTKNQKKLFQIWDEIQRGDNKAYELSIGQL